MPAGRVANDGEALLAHPAISPGFAAGAAHFLHHRELLGALSLAAYQTVKELVAAVAVERIDLLNS